MALSAARHTRISPTQHTIQRTPTGGVKCPSLTTAKTTGSSGQSALGRHSIHADHAAPSLERLRTKIKISAAPAPCRVERGFSSKRWKFLGDRSVSEGLTKLHLISVNAHRADNNVSVLSPRLNLNFSTHVMSCHVISSQFNSPGGGGGGGGPPPPPVGGAPEPSPGGGDPPPGVVIGGMVIGGIVIGGMVSGMSGRPGAGGEPVLVSGDEKKKSWGWKGGGRSPEEHSSYLPSNKTRHIVLV